MAATLGRVPEGDSDSKVRYRAEPCGQFRVTEVRGQARVAEKSENPVPPFAGKDASSRNPLAQTGRKCSDAVMVTQGPTSPRPSHHQEQ